MAKTQLITDIPSARADQYRSVYVNHARGNLTSWDLQFTFAVIGETTTNTPVVLEQVQLVMTLDFARAVAAMITDSIKTFEAVKEKEATIKLAAPKT